MELYQLIQKLQARREGRLLYCKKKENQTANMSGTAARTGMPVQVKAVFTVLKRLSKRNRLRKLTTVLMMNVFSVRFKIKKI